MTAIQNRMLIGLVVGGLAGGAFAGAETGRKGQAPPSTSRPEPTGATVKTDAKRQAAPDFPVILYIEKRGRTITVKAGPKGPLYSVKTAEGKTIIENVPAEQLRAKAPELHEFITTAVAGGTGKSKAVLDASLGMR